jgi:NADH-quinone oxidoreductase subunit I/NAD(P)H-quinone oxidoreductase subunit I
MASYYSRIADSVTSILEGMAVTLSWLFRRPCTVQWPDKIEKPIEETLPERYRGILEVETKLCTGCQACERTCPIGCILIATERNAETKERFITGFDIDAAKCMYCGLCVDACPTGAIRHTTQFAGATTDLRRLVLRYVQAGEKVVPHKPKTELTGLAPRGSLAAARVRNCFPEGEKGAR